jgi:LPS-assembly protein
MIAPLTLRTLWGVVICCAPVWAVWASGAPQSAASPTLAVASAEFQPDTPQSLEAAVSASCFARGAAAPVLVAQALPAPGSGRAPPPGPLQQLRRGEGAPRGPVSYVADTVSADQRGVVTLNGHVDVHQNDRELKADRIIYDRSSDDFNVQGNVQLNDPMLQVAGDSGHYNDAGGQFAHATFQLRGRPGRGTAQDMTTTPSDVITVHNVFFTMCPQGHTDWDIRAQQMRLDTAGNVGTVRGAKLDFRGVPFLYLPYLSFPLSDARRSGMLFPNFGTSSRDGVMLGVPWYWNIAPNQDATLTPTIYSRRGADLGTEYRFLSANDSGTFDGNYMPHDWEYGAEREYLRLLNRLELGDNSRVQTDLETVSDDEYFEDFSQGVEGTSTAFLPRNVALTHRDDVFTVSLQSLGFQTIDNTLPSYERPYVESPRLDASANWSPSRLGWLSSGFDVEVVNFSRSSCNDVFQSSAPGSAPLPLACGESPAGLPGLVSYFPAGVWVNGWRMNVMPHIGLDLTGPGYFFRPSVAWDFTQYELRNVGSPAVLDPGTTLPPYATVGGSADPERNLPVITVDSGLTFERLTGNGGARTVTLQPRAMYVYIPYRGQDQLPLFDTARPDPNLIELFRANRYVGEDRIGDANEFTLGLTSELFSTASGTRYVSATLGQSLYLTAPRVELPGETLGRSGSDVIGQVTVAAYHDWNVMLDVASNAQVSRIEELQAELQYRVDGQQLSNLSYQYAEGLYQQIDGSTAWPIATRWDVYARAVYSILSHSLIDDFAGFQYRSDCWAVRMLWQSSLATRTGARDSGVAVQVELSGLSNVGSEVETFLQQQIRGYLPLAPGRLQSTAPASLTPATPAP